MAAPLSWSVVTDQLSNKESSIASETLTSFCSLLSQLNRLAWIYRPDISFDICNLGTKIKNMEVCNVTELNKVVQYIKSEKNEIVFLDLNSAELIT